jgi:hypothetical protein
MACNAVRDFLNHNHIPFNTDINQKYKKKYGCLFITPNVTIIAAHFNKICRSCHITFYVDVINMCKNSEKPIYLYLYDTRDTNDTIYHAFILKMNELLRQNNAPNITYINDIKHLIYIPNLMEFDYITHVPQVIISLVTTNLPYLEGRTIFVSFETFYKAISLLTDDELRRLERYRFHLTEELPIFTNNMVYILNKTKGPTPRLHIVVKNTSLQSEQDSNVRHPVRLIDGVTMECANCHNIVYVNCQKHSCV